MKEKGVIQLFFFSDITNIPTLILQSLHDKNGKEQWGVIIIWINSSPGKSEKFDNVKILMIIVKELFLT